MPKPNRQVSAKLVLDSVANRPRNHLGDVVYSSQLRPARTTRDPNSKSSKFSFRSTPKPLPLSLITGKENCTLTVKVPRLYLEAQAREEITERAFLWGTGVYSDDSDVVAACIHDGWILGEWDESVDVELLKSTWDTAANANAGSGSKNQRGKQTAAAGGGAAGAADFDYDAVMLSPPKDGPVMVHPTRDMQVTVLVLPRLEHYASTTRFGIRSREWGVDRAAAAASAASAGVSGAGGDGFYEPAAAELRKPAAHDGLSFMIQSIRWVLDGAKPQSRLRGKARRERMRGRMRNRETVLLPVPLGEQWGLNSRLNAGGGGGSGGVDGEGVGGADRMDVDVESGDGARGKAAVVSSAVDEDKENATAKAAPPPLAREVAVAGRSETDVAQPEKAAGDKPGEETVGSGGSATADAPSHAIVADKPERASSDTKGVPTESTAATEGEDRPTSDVAAGAV